MSGPVKVTWIRIKDHPQEFPKPPNPPKPPQQIPANGVDSFKQILLGASPPDSVHG